MLSSVIVAGIDKEKQFVIYILRLFQPVVARLCLKAVFLISLGPGI
jgi:hypothetical protein